MRRRFAILGSLALVFASISWSEAQTAINPDVDRNGIVNSADVSAVRSRLNRICGQAGYLQAADVNGDCRINLTDANLVSQNLGLQITGVATPPANGAGWNNADVSVTFTCAGPFSSCQPPVQVSTEGAGQVVTGTVVGRSNATLTTSVSVNLDKTAPAITIASPVNNFVSDTSPIKVTGTLPSPLSPLDTLTCNGVAATVDGLAFSCAVVLQAGVNAIALQGTDVAGNVGTASVSVRLETGGPQVPPAPTLTITSPISLALFNGSQAPITVAGTVDDPNATVLITVPDAPNGVAAGVKGGTWQAQNVPLREGHNIITAKATNSQGGVATTTVTVSLDTTPPVIRIDGPSSGATLTNTQALVTGMVNDIVGGTVNSEEVSVTVNGVVGQVSNRSFIVPEVLLVRGVNTLTAVATDRAGNQSKTALQVTVQDAVGQQRILLKSGNVQSGPINGLLAEPLVVQLVDGSGQPVPDRSVTFRVTRSDGVIDALEQQGQDITVQSDVNGEAGVQFRLGSRTGVGNNQVTVVSTGFTGEVVFSASSTAGLPAQINRVSGENQRGQVGQPLTLPFVVLVYDDGGNPVEGVPVTFNVRQGGGTIEGVTELVKKTNSDGKADGLLTLGEQEGVNNQVVEVSFGASAGSALAMFTASALVPGNAADTTVSGVVLDNTDQPIVGATASIAGSQRTATTDQDGRFSIGNAPVGTVTLIVDGSTADEKFPFLAFILTTVAGTDNTVGMPIYIPAIDVANSKIVGGDEEVVLTMAGVPGVAFTIAPNSTTLPTGQHQPVRMVLSQVHADKVPMAPPNGSSPSLVWTLQPAGVHFDPPIRVQLPNTDGLMAGQVVEVFQFDHDLEQFVSVGQSRVSEDGSVITTDPGFGITKSGWGAPQPPPPPKNCTGSCNDQNTCTSDSGPSAPPGCQCNNTPANEGASCGGANDPGVNSCIEGKCKGGSCAGTPKAAGSTCNDNVFCTDPDKCEAGGACKGTKIEDVQGPAFSIEIKVADDFRGVLNALKGIFGGDGSVTVTNEAKQKFTCCEEKQQKNVAIKNLKYGVNMKLDSPRIPIPGLGFSIKVVKFGAYVTLGVNGSASLDIENNLCTENYCATGTIAVGGSIEVGVQADVGGDKILNISASCGTGLEINGSVSCKEYKFGLDLKAITCKVTVTLFDGFFAENLEYELRAAQPLLGGTPTPLPTF